jgi:DNA gyrase subunit A
MAEIDDLLDILAKPERVSVIIGDELTAIKQEFGQTSSAAPRLVEHSARSLDRRPITPTDMVVTLSQAATSRARPSTGRKARARQQATATKEDDWIDQLFIANTHDYILCFSNRGRLYWLKV